jgi:hypothetical protein
VCESYGSGQVVGSTASPGPLGGQGISCDLLFRDIGHRRMPPTQNETLSVSERQRRTTSRSVLALGWAGVLGAGSSPSPEAVSGSVAPRLVALKTCQGCLLDAVVEGELR